MSFVLALVWVVPDWPDQEFGALYAELVLVCQLIVVLGEEPAALSSSAGRLKVLSIRRADTGIPVGNGRVLGLG